MAKFDISIIEYLGKVESGILVLISIMYDNSYYESTFYYNDKDILLTISEDLENIIGMNIKDHPQYSEILSDILKKIVPYSEMIDNIDNVNFSRWVKGIIEIENKDDPEMVDPSTLP